jgi:hypothetical protein
VAHAAEGLGFVADFQGADRGLAQAFEFGVAAVRPGCDGLAGVGDPGGFPVGGGRGAPGIVLAQRWGGVRGQDAEPAGQPRLGAGGQLVAERAGPLVQPGGQFVRDCRRVGRCPVGLGHGVAEVG